MATIQLEETPIKKRRRSNRIGQNGEEVQTFAFWLTVTDRDMLDAIADSEGLTASGVLRQAVRRLIANNNNVTAEGA